MTQIYPDIYYPQPIAAVKKLGIKSSPLAPSPPSITPPKEPQPFPRNIVFGLAIATAIASLATQSLEIFGVMTLLTLGVTGYLWFSYGGRRRKFEAAARDYELIQSKYEKQLSAYDVEQKEYERWLAERRQKLLNALATTNPPDGTGSNAQQGWSEANFVNVLQQYFPGKIYSGFWLQNPSYSNGYHYTADACYWDSDLKLYIDIELDEPYGYKSGKLIHCLGDEREEIRHKHFLSCGWFIIRFAEEQVVRYPESCCRAIAELIAEITGEPIPANFAIIPPLLPIKRWTSEEAFEMWKQQYRNTYLN